MVKISGCDFYLDRLFKLFLDDFNPTNKEVVSIGCGNRIIEEYAALVPLYKQFGMTVNLTGIDKDSSRTETARKELGDKVLIHHNDAQDISKIITTEVGLVIIRHPDIEVDLSRTRAWTNVLRNVRSIVSPDAWIFATHFSYHGYAALRDGLENAGYTLQPKEYRHDILTPVLNLGTQNSLDGYVIVAN